MTTLLEKYSDRINKASAIAAQAGNTFDNQKKMVLAHCLNNIDRFLNEALT